MTEKEMIEEMARLLTGCCKRLDEKGQPIGFKCLQGCEYFDKETGICSSFNQKEAKTLYNAGYRKIPEGAVVLTREEYEKLKSLSTIEEITLGAVYDNTRKETAEKIFDFLRKDNGVNAWTIIKFEKFIKEQFGVEVE